MLIIVKQDKVNKIFGYICRQIEIAVTCKVTEQVNNSIKMMIRTVQNIPESLWQPFFTAASFSG